MRINQKPLLGIFSFLVIVYSFINIFRSGINWDSVFDLNAARSTMQLDNAITLIDAYEKIPLTSEFYGIFIYQLSNFLHHIVFFSPLDFNSTSLTTFRFINATSFLVTLISTMILAFTVYRISNSQRFAFVFFLISITAPNWVGMSQINTKDMPFAAGLTILASGMMVMINSIPSKKTFLHSFLLSASGSFIAVGTRAGGFIIVLGILLASLLVFILKNRHSGVFKEYLVFSVLLFSSTLATLFVLLLNTNPLARIDLFNWLRDAFKVSGDFPSIQPVRALGQDLLSDQLPFWYIPAWIFAQLPVLLIVLLLIGLVQILFKIFVNRNIELFYLFAPLTVQGFIFPLILIVQNINMYNGVRHVYFIFPLLFLIAAFPLTQYSFSSNNLRNSNFRIKLLAGLLIFFNTFALVRWMPYSYAFINPIAGLGETRNWDLDYWGVTSTEGVKKLRNQTSINEIVVMPDISSSIPVQGLPSQNFQDSKTKYGLYVYIHWNHKILSEKCDIRFTLKRDNQTLGMGGVCPKS
jgi:hypothetical protein